MAQESADRHFEAAKPPDGAAEDYGYDGRAMAAGGALAANKLAAQFRALSASPPQRQEPQPQTSEDVARLLQTRAAQEGQIGLYDWQDIATAPKDVPVLGFLPTAYQGTGGVETVQWQDGKWWMTGAWSVEPTHWMPLPAPPEATHG